MSPILRSLVCVVTTMMMLTSCATDISPDLGARSRLLRVGDTEDVVIKKMGVLPNSVEMTTCGQTKTAPCKLYWFKNYSQRAFVIFIEQRAIASFKIPLEQLPKDWRELNDSHANFIHEFLASSWRVFN